MELIINFSGGKDSCAMLCYLCSMYPHVKKHVVFANTGWEHKDAEQWCEKIVSLFNLELHTCKNQSKTFLTMVKNRKKFPSPSQRQCTSDLKRDPINAWIRNNTTDNIIINCLGLRSEESPTRAKHKKLSRNKRLCNSKRTVWDWLPIKDWNEKQVLDYLDVNSIPLHPVYSYLKRFSCRVCIYMTDQDLKQVHKNDPEAIQIISALEREINFSMKQTGFIDELINRSL